MKYDKPLVVVLLGAIATIPYEIITRILRAVGVGKFSVYELSSLIVTINRPTAILGVVVTSIVSGTLAILLYHALKKLGSDYVVIKSIGIGLFGWVLTETTFTWLIEGPGHMFRPVSDYYLEICGAIVFGTVLGLLFRWFITPALNQPKVKLRRYSIVPLPARKQENEGFKKPIKIKRLKH